MINHCVAVTNNSSAASNEQSDRLNALIKHNNFYTALLNEKPELGATTPEQFEAQVSDFNGFFEKYKTEFSIDLFK